MTRPPFEVADIIRAHGNSLIEKSRSWLTWLHVRVLFAIEHCRAATLSGHLDRCRQCGHEAISFNSCRSRHCPKCQTNARDKWLAGRTQELLPINYVHVVFTIPHQLSWLALQNKKVVYDLLFRASAATLLEIAADPKHLGAEIGFLSVLHTSPAHPLRDSLRWSRSRSPTLGTPAVSVLPADKSAGPRLSRHVHRRAQASFR